MSENTLSFVRVYTLIPQTPLIHFQYQQPGATLRATEVKPKLDAFLTKKAKKEGIDLSRYCIKDTKALDYKMRLCALERNQVEIGYRTDYDIYYGNMGRNAVRKEGVLSKTSLTVVCVIPELLKLLERYISEFFAVTNFGTMSGKGFGSFIVEEKQLNGSAVAKALKEEYGATRCYSFEGGRTPFKTIKIIYSLMKSGINNRGYEHSLLFKYMHETYGIGNEKAWLKQKKLAPAIYKSQNREIAERKSHQYDGTSRYVRALLGTGEKFEFLNQIGDWQNKTVVKIESIDGDKIERSASPIVFKVVGRTVYMIAARINPNIYGGSFRFGGPMGHGELKVPEKNELGEHFIDDFMAYAVKEINRGIADKFANNNRIFIREV